MTKAILDSNFLVALIDEKDKWTKTAISIQKALKKKKARLVYLDCAVNETISVIARRLCVFRPIPSTHSGLIRPPIPIHSVH
jgi:predicted nucleic acid-binding protein